MANPTLSNHEVERVQSGINYKKRKFPKYEVHEGDQVKIYIWELPVRIFHWINAISIFVLMVTGIYIGKPFVAALVQEEAYYSWFMGWARYIHFFFAFLFIANLLFRWYWVFKGNRFATAKPFQLAFWKELFQTIKYYGLMKHKKPHFVGHNPLAQFSYLLFIGVGSVIMILTGIYMYVEPQHESWFGQLFQWVPWLLGGNSYAVRSLHHLVAWGFIIFVVIHIYMAFREDWLERNGTMSSIFTGYKFESKEMVEAENDEK